MENRPLVSITKTGVTIAPELFDLLLAYLEFFINDRQWRLDAYRRDHAGADSQTGDADATIVSLQREIDQAQARVRDVETLRDRMRFIYNWHFEKCADVLRKSRIHMEQKKIQDMYSLKVVLSYTIDMLKREHRLFSESQFISYVNEGGNI